MSSENTQSENNSTMKKRSFDNSQSRKIILIPAIKPPSRKRKILPKVTSHTPSPTNAVSLAMSNFYNPQQANSVTGAANSKANILANTMASTSRPKLNASRSLPQKQLPGSLPCPRQITSVNKNPRFAGRGLIGLWGQPLDAHDGIGLDGIPKYKRPPHTYPALIASAILDSEQHLVTLRDIYDYIMNNVPYYKYCHQKAGWQNSIRHNLSLDNCFIKVPRYDGSSKSNYWTMNQEGFEQFGTDCSFNRTRRRGSTVPINKHQKKTQGNNNQSELSNEPGRNSPPDLNKRRQLIQAVVDAKQRIRNGGRQVDEPANKIQRMIVVEEPEVPVLRNITSSATQTQLTDSTSSKLKCEYCDITFGDDAMHAMHMTCHDPQDPFKCKICGEQCGEKYNFNVHILKGPHKQ